MCHAFPDGEIGEKRQGACPHGVSFSIGHVKKKTNIKINKCNFP